MDQIEFAEIDISTKGPSVWSTSAWGADEVA